MKVNGVMKKRSVARRFSVWAGLLLIVIVGAFGAYFINKSNTLAISQASVKFATPELQVQMAQYERKIYPYSVIRGGLQSREELSASIRNDDVVAEHYSDFDVSKAKIAPAPTTRAMYVSYRMGDTIYWTANKIQIPQGETLITDGTHEARTRCGNMLSDTPMTPLSGEEPDKESFDIPHVAELDTHELTPSLIIGNGLTPLSQFPDVELSESPIPLTGGNALPTLSRPPSSYLSGPPVGMASLPIIPPGDSSGIGIGMPGDILIPGDPYNPNVVPEPGTMFLVFTGLAIASVFKIRQR